MTPKEKAEELFYKMQLDWACDSCHNDWAKECALIAVDEILDIIRYHGTDIGKHSLMFWKEVKHEIEKL